MSGGKRFAPAKFRGIVNYVLTREDVTDLTLSKLCNLLYLTDFEAYRELGASITGATYIKMDWGAFPVVKSRPRKSAFDAAGISFMARVDLLAAATDNDANEIRIATHSLTTGEARPETTSAATLTEGAEQSVFSR